jgi:hypothetical protein
VTHLAVGFLSFNSYFGDPSWLLCLMFEDRAGGRFEAKLDESPGEANNLTLFVVLVTFKDARSSCFWGVEIAWPSIFILSVLIPQIDSPLIAISSIDTVLWVLFLAEDESPSNLFSTVSVVAYLSKLLRRVFADYRLCEVMFPNSGMQ